MGALKYLAGKIGSTTFLEKCRNSFHLQPKHTVFIFPSNREHHGKGITLGTVKKGSGLAEVAQKLGAAGYPTLGLPTKGMKGWPDDKELCAIVNSALYDLFRAVGAGYNVVLPVRAREDGKNAFEQELAACPGCELSFWGGVVKPDNPKLAAHYDAMVSILDAVMQIHDELNRTLFITNMHQLTIFYETEKKTGYSDPRIPELEASFATEENRAFASNIPATLKKIITDPKDPTAINLPGLNAIMTSIDGYGKGVATLPDDHWLMPSYLEKPNATYTNAPKSKDTSLISEDRVFLDGARALLQKYTHRTDYNKPESCARSIYRMFQNISVNNTKAVDTILMQMSNKTIVYSPERLVAELKAIKTKDHKDINPEGTLAHIIELLESKLKALQNKKPTEDIDLPPQRQSPHSGNAARP